MLKLNQTIFQLSAWSQDKKKMLQTATKIHAERVKVKRENPLARSVMMDSCKGKMLKM